MADYRQAFFRDLMPWSGTAIGHAIERVIMLDDEQKPWITRATWGELREDVENAFLDEMESLTEPARDALDEMERRYEWAKGVGYDSGYSDGYDNGYNDGRRDERLEAHD